MWGGYGVKDTQAIAYLRKYKTFIALR